MKNREQFGKMNKQCNGRFDFHSLHTTLKEEGLKMTRIFSPELSCTLEYKYNDEGKCIMASEMKQLGGILLFYIILKFQNNYDNTRNYSQIF